MSYPRLHLISDRTLCPLDRLPEVARAAVRGGVDVVHLREKDLPGGALMRVARELIAALGTDARVFVNERIDVALLAGADGVQLGEAAIPPADARALVGDRLLISCSVHDLPGARRAISGGADALLAGHVYASRSKAGIEPRGSEWLAEIARASRVPVVAIGGITPERMPEVIAAGAHGVAVISGILAAADPEAAARRYRAALE